MDEIWPMKSGVAAFFQRRYLLYRTLCLRQVSFITPDGTRPTSEQVREAFKEVKQTIWCAFSRPKTDARIATGLYVACANLRRYEEQMESTEAELELGMQGLDLPAQPTATAPTLLTEIQRQ